MGTFDEDKAYARQEDVYFDDGREDELLKYILSRDDIRDLEGSPHKVLAAIDSFGTQRYLMNVGQCKGEIVTDLISRAKPKTMVELGGYVGYSAILFADAVRAAGGKRYFCLEHNPRFASIISKLTDLAGLGDMVTVLVGDSGDSLGQLKSQGTMTHIDVLFLDHHKPLYLRDLKLCEELGFIQPGTILAADNVIKPGNPPYLEYVRSSVEQKKQALSCSNATPTQGEANRECASVGSETCSREAGQGHGRPALVYESQLVRSFEPTGVPDGIEITHCVGLDL
ncbi:hypothetical protein ED733_001942 [Metarhizium rileyi]|uniref:catechol O-methyltransferase n=1 Tax=Metarhizium rileyi (strain RCEF 4871) TaxID=1649241 RepID=A0A5C6G2E0_METRR|nr:hypothetical protein ED733_001942 [Metarhizium rileyi]